MGSSGAGKTTLLNSLAFRSPAGVQVSHAAVRALNGIPVNAKQLRSRCAYIQQDDLFIGSLTAREHLIFQVNIGPLHAEIFAKFIETKSKFYNFRSGFAAIGSSNAV